MTQDTEDELTPRHPPIWKKTEGVACSFDHLPPISFGAATFGNAYSQDDHLRSQTPLKAVRLALRYGLAYFDTSPYYGHSEEVLGGVLDSLRDEFPRDSYMIVTKTGRYGLKKQDFDYSPQRVKESVKESLRRLKTDYLDLVYLHDVEYVADLDADDLKSPRNFKSEGLRTPSWRIFSHSNMISDILYVVQEGVRNPSDLKFLADETSLARSRGPGDEKIIQAAATLFQLKDEGIIRNVGISGYPLPTLLRLSILIRLRLQRPLDAIMSFSHSNLQNYSLADYTPHFHDSAGVKNILTASPLNMGLLTERGPPSWHPSPAGLRDTAHRAADMCRERGTTLMKVAEGFSMRWDEFVGRTTGKSGGPPSTVVVGLSNPREVHEAVDVYVSLKEKEEREKHDEDMKLVMKVFQEDGWANWNWVEEELTK
ncbi:hypothetical protein PROFUN_16492 [Planoprotostelium fungivorum]|uniref:NADP-dependent oxidoreductase domain-containing protein n=1 Tax=Planoprotostelium fungivorum TaxID=1890364 RepID=A0A2P6MQ84_9EUKA|nr:hypothetical protein PROFUN_16492 [Planoprotostelium fungivorum]